MNEYPDLKQEVSERNEDFNLLESLEGFKRLSVWQRRIIKASLFITDRYNRIESIRRYVKYKPSREHMESFFCHAAAYFLEHGEVVLYRDKETESKFIEAEYLPVINPDIDQVKNYISQIGLPCVVVISSFRDKKKNPYRSMHTFIALGLDDKENVITWDKEGYGYPYRIITLEEIYEFYKKYKKIKWGVRKINTEKVNENE